MPRGDVKDFIPAPVLGFRADAPSTGLPINAILSGSNVIIRNNRLFVRPGLKTMDTTGFGEQVMGGLFYKLASGVKRTIAAGITKRKYFDGSQWIDITGPVWTGDRTTFARFVPFPTGATIYYIGVNGKDATVEWDGLTATDSALGGSAPIAKDVCVCANRVIYGNVIVGGIPYPNAFIYSAFNNHQSTPAANIVNVSEGTGVIVAVRTLSEQSFAVYTERAQHVVTAQGGVAPFLTNYRDRQPGPVSAAAVVSADQGLHRYLGNDGNFYQFDGVSCKPFGNAVRTAVQASMNADYRDSAHGVFDRGFREIHWFWTPLGASGNTAGISYNIDNQIWSPIHSFSKNLSSSFEWDEWFSLTWNDLIIYPDWPTLGTVYPTWLSMGQPSAPTSIIGQQEGQTYLLGGLQTDDGTAIEAEWVYPVKPMTGHGTMTRVNAIEALFKQTTTPMPADMYLGTAKYPGGPITYQPAVRFDISLDALPIAEYNDVASRFQTVKFVIPAADRGVEFHGLIPYGYARKVAA